MRVVLYILVVSLGFLAACGDVKDKKYSPADVMKAIEDEVRMPTTGDRILTEKIEHINQTDIGKVCTYIMTEEQEVIEVTNEQFQIRKTKTYAPPSVAGCRILSASTSVDNENKFRRLNRYLAKAQQMTDENYYSGFNVDANNPKIVSIKRDSRKGLKIFEVKISYSDKNTGALFNHIAYLSINSFFAEIVEESKQSLAGDDVKARTLLKYIRLYNPQTEYNSL